MLKLIYSHPTPDQEIPDEETQGNKHAEKPNPPQKALCSHLKLVVSNPSVQLGQGTPSIRNSSTTSAFKARVRVIGPWLYEMAVQDPTFYLKCNLTLEVEEAQSGIGPGRVICHFPTILDKYLNAFVEEDETLHGVVMVQFQMKVMEQLLLFCGNYRVSHLVIYTDDEQAEELGIYHDFLVHQDRTLTSQGEKTEMVIATDPETFDDWIDFMDEANRELQQGLWREQRSNPAVRCYLKSRTQT